MTIAQPFLTETKGLWIDGEFTSTDETFETFNPATGKSICSVAYGTAEDVDRAVASSRKAFLGWASMAPKDRSRWLYLLADAIEAKAEALAKIEVLDNGKPYKEALKGDLPLAVEHFRYYAGWPTKLEGKTLPVSIPGVLNYTLREPIGVVGAIIPWNFPLLMAAWKLAPALAAGCTVVLKPAEQTPLSALMLAEILQDICFPAGVINIVTGNAQAGAALVAHPDVDKISFTGSTSVGRNIMRSAADRLKRVALELGGKSANIIFADADLKRAVRGAYSGIFYNQGQMCIAGSRILVESSVLDAFVEQLKTMTEAIRLGDGMDPETQMGPLVSKTQQEQVLGYVELGLEEGGTLIAGGTPWEGSDGYFVKPTLFMTDNTELQIVREEIFGPVATIIPFDTEEQAIRIANDTPYGLAGGLWTQNVGRGMRVAQSIRAGTVWINSYNLFDPSSPYGGVKESGFGREMGEEGLALYTETKSVWVPMK